MNVTATEIDLAKSALRMHSIHVGAALCVRIWLQYASALSHCTVVVPQSRVVGRGRAPFADYCAKRKWAQSHFEDSHGFHKLAQT